jgi:hypothetical protein
MAAVAFLSFRLLSDPHVLGHDGDYFQATPSSTVTTEFDASDLLDSSMLPLLLSAVGGFVVPYLDNVLGLTTRRCLTYALASFESTGILFMLRVISGYVSTPILSSLFKLFGIWHVLLFITPMVLYIQGLETDNGVLEYMAEVELQLFFYFGPTIVPCVWGYLWGIRIIITYVLVVLIGTLALCPSPLRSRIILTVLKGALNVSLLHNRYDINIRGLFVHVCDMVISPFDRWEIGFAQQHRERSQLSSTPYQYKKLESYRYIRLLRLKRRSFFSEPSCELIHVSLNEAPSFEAISYTWGPMDPSIPIIVDGRQILVTATVDELLFHRRSVFCSNLFWIDAICINQSDKIEKGEQLPLMTDIYRRASRVLVWLGAPESSRNTRITRKMITALAWPRVLFPYFISFVRQTFPKEEEAYTAVGRLFSHPWFERIWVVQEVASGKTVHVMYHGICVELETLARAAKHLGSDTELKSLFLYHNFPKTTSINMLDTKLGRSSTVDVIQQFLRANLEFMTGIRESVQLGHPSPLALNLTKTISFKSKDPRDKIFAILGITGDGDKLPFKPSYEDEVEDVFLKTTAFILSTEEWFLTFMMAGRGYESFTYNATRSEYRDKLPSWVPDFSSDTIAGSRPPSETSIQARDKTGKIKFTSDCRVIQLEAIKFDEIKHMGPKLKVRSSSPYLPNPNVSIDIHIAQSAQLQALVVADEGDWYLKARQLARIHPSPKSQETTDQDFWELCMSQGELGDSWGKPHTVCSPLSVSARKFFEHILLTEPTEVVESNYDSILGSLLGKKVTVNEALTMRSYLMRRFSWTAGGKAFCITAAGSMALVPPLASGGDALVHIRGGYFPIVLRPTGTGERRAELVGACTVHRVEDVYSGSVWENWLLE